MSDAQGTQIDDDSFQIWYFEKRRNDTRNRVRRSRARQVALQAKEEACQVAQEAFVLECVEGASSKIVDCYARQTRKVNAKIAKRIALFTVDQLKDMKQVARKWYLRR